MNNIIIRRYGNNRTIWVSEAMIEEKAGISNKYVRKVRHEYKSQVPVSQRNSDVLPLIEGASWRWGEINGQFYYDYETIPNRAPKYYRTEIGNMEQVLTMGTNPIDDGEVRERAKKILQEEVERYIVHTHEHYYMYESPTTFHREVAISITRAVGYAKLLISARRDKGYIRYGIETIGEFDAMAAELMSELDLKGFKVGNPIALRRKLDEFVALGDEQKQLYYMMPKNYGNRNAALVGKLSLVDEKTGEIMECDIHETLMYYYFMNKANAAIEFKNTLYNKYYLTDMEALGLSDRAVSMRTFCHHTNKFATKIKTHRERYGKDRYNKHLLTYVPMEKLRYANSLLVADGSGMKIAYKGQDGKAVTLYMMRIFDVASTALIGYAISPNKNKGEDKEYVMASLKMAIETADGYGAMDFLTDNGGSFKTEEMQDKFKMLFGKVRSIQVGNSQENDAERFNKLLNNGARQFDNWRGQFQAHDKEYKANPDKMILVSKDEAMMQALTMIEQYNNHIGPDGLTRMERFKQNRHPEAKQIDEQVLRYVFGNESKVDLSYMRGFVNVYHRGMVKQYTIPGMKSDGLGNGDSLVVTYEMLNRAMGSKGDLNCMVKWDEKIADIYTLQGKYLVSCEAVKKAYKSYAEATEESKENMGKLIARKREQIEATEQYREQIERGMEILQDKQVAEKLDYGVIVATSDEVKEWSGSLEDVELQEMIEVASQDRGKLTKKKERRSVKEDSLNDL